MHLVFIQGLDLHLALDLALVLDAGKPEARRRSWRSYLPMIIAKRIVQVHVEVGNQASGDIANEVSCRRQLARWEQLRRR